MASRIVLSGELEKSCSVLKQVLESEGEEMPCNSTGSAVVL